MNKGRAVCSKYQMAQRLERPLRVACRLRNYDAMKCLLEGGALPDPGHNIILDFFDPLLPLYDVNENTLKCYIRKYYGHIVLLLSHGLDIFKHSGFMTRHYLFPKHMIKVWAWNQSLNVVLSYYTKDGVFLDDEHRQFFQRLKPFFRIIEEYQNRHIMSRLASVSFGGKS